jgi:glutamate-1-semialdehyde aminotransferase
MINEGVQLMGDGMMVSSVHNDSDVDRTVAAFRASLRAMKDDGAVF